MIEREFEGGWKAGRTGRTIFSMLSFTDDFNPKANDRNLEFDPQKNLFTDLKNEEKVREP